MDDSLHDIDNFNNDNHDKINHIELNMSDISNNNSPINTTTELDEQEELIISRLNNMNEDQLKELITSQIDLEIRLKHQELNVNDYEISKMEAQLLMLRKFLELPQDTENELTMRYYKILNDGLIATYSKFKQIPEDQLPIQPKKQNRDEIPFFDKHPIIPGEETHGYRTRSTTSSLRPSATSSTTLGKTANLGCLYRRTDGVIVRLKCPVCQRINFSSAQGFLNHSRIAHSTEYSSQDAAALKCGEILPEIKQDSIGQASITIILQKGLDPNKSLSTDDSIYGVEEIPIREFKEIPKEVVKEEIVKPKVNHELYKKLLKDKKMSKEEYDKLINDAIEPIDNSHLFDDEEEEIEETSGASSRQPSLVITIPNLKRRVSRGGINIPQETKRKK
ncbi:unnamed protein product [Candida verbasci]|uniref:AHC1-like C2H2 zinc-finger domain-containing protein n=1 Tax=Candida verbasci TaxID=1227364 RepID=A0A9W4X8G5_9ASCO|nr:unnamed protein product [Candida verbasci]